MSIILVLILNFVLSWWNAYAVGTVWHPAKYADGFTKLVVWAGAIMSAVGFTYVFMFVFGGIVFHLDAVNHFGPEDTRLFSDTLVTGYYSLGLLIVWPVIISSGLVITMHSYRKVAQRGSVGDYLEAGWNTYAMVHDMSVGIEHIPGLIDNVGDMFDGAGDGDDELSGLAMLILLGMLLVAIAAGIMLTYTIIKHTSRNALMERFS